MSAFTHFCFLLFMFGAGVTCYENTKEVLEGRNVLEICKVEIPDRYALHWQGRHLSYYQSGPMLDIKNITRNFTDEYVCIHYDKNTKQLTEVLSVYINVTYPAKITSMDIDKTTLEDNETVNMTVTVEGNPAPETRIFHLITGKNVFKTNHVGTLQIKFTPKCNGWDDYMLKCKNRFETKKIIFNLTVLCAPKPSIPPRDNLSPRLGDDIILEINSVGYPPPTYNWQFNGVPVSHDDDDQHSTVHINGVKVCDFGNYTMKMKNSQGEYTQMYSVYAYGPPDPATHLQAGNITFNAAELCWLPGFDYGNNQTFTLLNEQGETHTELASIQGRLGEMIKVTYTIHNLIPEKEYTMSLKSNNCRGDAILLSNKIHFTTAKDADHLDTAVIIIVVILGVTVVGYFVFIYMKRKRTELEERRPLIDQCTDRDSIEVKQYAITN